MFILILATHPSFSLFHPHLSPHRLLTSPPVQRAAFQSTGLSAAIAPSQQGFRYDPSIFCEQQSATRGSRTVHEFVRRENQFKHTTFWETLQPETVVSNLLVARRAVPHRLDRQAVEIHKPGVNLSPSWKWPYFFWWWRFERKNNCKSRLGSLPFLVFEHSLESV